MQNSPEKWENYNSSLSGNNGTVRAFPSAADFVSRNTVCYPRLKNTAPIRTVPADVRIVKYIPGA